MNVPVALSVPTARTWRAMVRQRRRSRTRRSFGETFNDLYTLLWGLGVYGGLLVAGIRHHLAAVAPAASAELHWTMIAALLTGTGLVWHALRLVGPLLATPAEQAWGVSTPVDRRGWLLPRFTALVAALGVGATVAALVAAIALRVDTVGWIAFGGLGVGVALAAGSVAAQRPRPAPPRWVRLPTVLLLACGMLVGGLVVAAHYRGITLGTPDPRAALVLVLGVLPVAVVAVVAGGRTLRHLDRITLGAGAQVAEATVTATVGLDPSLLSGVLEVRRWRRIGRVRSRPLGGGPFGPTFARAWVLVRTEFRRQLRRPTGLALWAALALAQYVVAVAAPSAAPVARLVLAYLAAGRLTSGLRTLGSSPGLRRALGGTEWELRAAHLVVPLLGTLLWWGLTWPTSGAPLGRSALLWVASVVGAAYRSATHPPMSYDGAVVETPFGQLPVDLISQMMRGPDLLALALVIRILAKG